MFEEIKKAGFADVDAYDALEALETKHFAPRPIIYVCSPYSGDILAMWRRQRSIVGSL